MSETTDPITLAELRAIQNVLERGDDWKDEKLAARADAILKQLGFGEKELHFSDEVFVEYSLGLLDEQKKQEVDDHIVTCEPCNRHLAFLVQEAESWQSEDNAHEREAGLKNLIDRINQSTPSSLKGSIQPEGINIKLPYEIEINPTGHATVKFSSDSSKITEFSKCHFSMGEYEVAREFTLPSSFSTLGAGSADRSNLKTATVPIPADVYQKLIAGESFTVKILRSETD